MYVHFTQRSISSKFGLSCLQKWLPPPTEVGRFLCLGGKEFFRIFLRNDVIEIRWWNILELKLYILMKLSTPNWLVTIPFAQTKSNLDANISGS